MRKQDLLFIFESNDYCKVSLRLYRVYENGEWFYEYWYGAREKVYRNLEDAKKAFNEKVVSLMNSIQY